MLVDYKDISDDAKVWVYPSSRKFYTNEIEAIEEQLKSFVESWKNEDENFKATYQFLHQRFIVIIADDSNTALGTKELDEAVSFVFKLQEQYKVTLLDRMNVCFKQGQFIQYKELKDFKKLLKNKAITGKTVIFDNLVANNYDFKNNWELPIEESWYNRYL